MSTRTINEAGQPAGARAVAARVLGRVIGQGAFVVDALHTELVQGGLSERDRALATELSYGCVRTLGYLDRRISELSRQGRVSDDRVRCHLLVAAYQVLFLDRVPAFAAINEAVEQVKGCRGPKVAGFVNGVLRALSRQSGSALSQAIQENVPGWLLSRLVEATDEATALSYLGLNSGEQPHGGVCVRLRKPVEPAPDWLRQARAGRLVQSARWVSSGGDPRTWDGYSEGQFVVQEEGAQWAARCVGARPGESVLDACAGHGQKSAILAEQLGAEGKLWVNDLHEFKLRKLSQEFARLGLAAPQSSHVDFAVPAPGVPQDFDRVLVDAPCTGIGTLRRRPEILLRLKPTDPERMAKVAEALLRNAARHVRPGGHVTYVVCSVLREESEAVVARVADILQPRPFDAPCARELAGAQSGMLRLSPLVHGTDGYFVANLRRSS